MLAQNAVDICLLASAQEADEIYRISVVFVVRAQSTIAQSVLLIVQSAAKRGRVQQLMPSPLARSRNYIAAGQMHGDVSLLIAVQEHNNIPDMATGCVE